MVEIYNMIVIMFLATSVMLCSSAKIGENGTDAQATCGVPYYPPHLNGLGRIIGGTEAKKNSWPWMCQFRFKPNKKADYTYCGAVVLDSTTLLTAAQCRIDTKKNGDTQEEKGDGPIGEIRCGIHYTYDSNWYEQKIVLPNYKFIPHENYGKPSRYHNDYDIAILKLTTPLTLNAEVSPVCLPTDSEGPYDGVGVFGCTATGWGYTRDSSGVISNPLMQVYQKIIPDATCHAKGEGTSPRDLCAAGENGSGVCGADGGGPLVCKHGELPRWVVQGIFVWYNPPCGSSIAGFSSVYHYRDWIKKHLN